MLFRSHCPFYKTRRFFLLGTNNTGLGNSQLRQYKRHLGGRRKTKWEEHIITQAPSAAKVRPTVSFASPKSVYMYRDFFFFFLSKQERPQVIIHQSLLQSGWPPMLRFVSLSLTTGRLPPPPLAKSSVRRFFFDFQQNTAATVESNRVQSLVGSEHSAFFLGASTLGTSWRSFLFLLRFRFRAWSFNSNVRQENTCQPWHRTKNGQRRRLSPRQIAKSFRLQKAYQPFPSHTVLNRHAVTSSFRCCGTILQKMKKLLFLLGNQFPKYTDFLGLHARKHVHTSMDRWVHTHTHMQI